QASGGSAGRTQTTTKRPLPRTLPPVRIPPGYTKIKQGATRPVSLLSAGPYSPFGMQFYSPMFGIMPKMDSTNDTTDSSNMTTTVNPVESTTPAISLTTMPTVSNATTTSNATVEYEDVEEPLTSPPEYDYPNEGNSTAPAVIGPVTEPPLNVTSTHGPNMIRKRRKKVVSTPATPSPNPGVVRIRLRRKKTTIAPVTNTTTTENAN
uniref:Uncharacterized protein n=1 Tax=Anopheles minimus TaxID=112268 RepID=A0A182VZT6_9DIPT